MPVHWGSDKNSSLQCSLYNTRITHLSLYAHTSTVSHLHNDDGAYTYQITHHESHYNKGMKFQSPSLIH